jgi:hypothetical protein
VVEIAIRRNPLVELINTSWRASSFSAYKHWKFVVFDDASKQRPISGCSFLINGRNENGGAGKLTVIFDVPWERLLGKASLLISPWMEASRV